MNAKEIEKLMRETLAESRAEGEATASFTGGKRGAGVLELRARRGAGVWTFRFTAPGGRRDRLTIGPLATGMAARDDEQIGATYTYAQARAKADEWGALLKDPATADIRAFLERQAAQRLADEQAALDARASADAEAERQRQFSFGPLLRVYVEHLHRRGKASAKQVGRLVEQVLREHPALAATPAAQVTRRDLAIVARGYAETGRENTAAKFVAYASAAYSLAMGAESDATAPREVMKFDIQANPAGSIKKPSPKRRDRVLTDVELRHVLERLEADERIGAQVVRLALWSGGQRPQQVLRATVADLDDDGVLRLFDAKGRRAEAVAHLVPLQDQALAFARSRALLAHSAGWPYLFTTRGAGNVNIRTVSDVAIELSAEMVASGISASPWQLKDLRRTAETRLAALGISRDVRAQLLSHGRGGVQAAYDRHHYLTEKGQALRAWESHLSDVRAGVARRSRVVPLMRATA